MHGCLLPLKPQTFPPSSLQGDATLLRLLWLSLAVSGLWFGLISEHQPLIPGRLLLVPCLHLCQAPPSSNQHRSVTAILHHFNGLALCLPLLSLAVFFGQGLDRAMLAFLVFGLNDHTYRLSSCTMEVSLWPLITICCSFSCFATYMTQAEAHEPEAGG